MSGESPRVPDKLLAAITERKNAARREINDILKRDGLGETVREDLYLWLSMIKDVETLVSVVRQQAHYIDINVH